MVEMDADEDDYVFYGTPIELEEETSVRKRKAIADAGQLRSLPLWKQEVRDEEGRRRFHGAFTGGFSAGYYNTAGSKEGWTPQTFTSSRKNRAELKQQSVYNFLDEDDIKAMGGHALETSIQFDTFGFTAAEYARKQAEKEQQKRQSAIPGPVPDEIILPAANSIGVKLLMKMGWRQGRSIKDANADSLYESRREARRAFLAFSGNKEPELAKVESSMTDTDEFPERSNNDLHASGSTPVYVLQPKQDLYGLGYDPFKLAPEFRDRKRLRETKSKHRDKDKNDVARAGNLLVSNSGKYAPGFGIGALEELDVEDEDIYASGFDYEQTEVEVEPSRMISDKIQKLEDRKQGVLLGFKVSSNSDYKLERFHPPVIPADFVPHHKFPTPLGTTTKSAELPPPEVVPPEDNNLRLLIEGSAAMVARCGKFMEDFYKEKSKTNMLFHFLSGGDGHDYYARKLWEQKQKYVDQQRQDDPKPKASVANMTAENRGTILGERQLDRSSKASRSSVSAQDVIHLQSSLGDTFTKPSSVVGLPESAKPFRSDPAKQDRFEQFLKEKYQGGLRSAHSLAASSMSEADRARERLDFEAAAEAIEKGKLNTHDNPMSIQQPENLPGKTQKGGIAQDEKKIYPKREEFEWRPSPILCKRFDILDPFMGKPLPMQRPRSKMDTLIFMAESVKSSIDGEGEASNRNLGFTSQSGSLEAGTLETDREPDIEPGSTLKRPVDLYKAIFSDDSDDDGDGATANANQTADPAKTSEGANMTLNRLVAGDFLESLGKELGLEVPPDISSQPFKAGSLPPTESASNREASLSSNEKSSALHERPNIHVAPRDTISSPRQTDNTAIRAASTKAHDVEVSRHKENVESYSEVKEGKFQQEGYHSVRRRSRSRSPDSGSSDQPEVKKRNHSMRHRGRSISPHTDSSGDGRQSKSRRQQRHRRSRTPESESNSGDRNQEQSKSRDKKSSGKAKRGRHSRHHKHERKDSRNRY